MHALEYVAVILYALALVRCFSFGIFGLKNGKNGLFVVALTVCAVGTVLFYKYWCMAVI